MIIDSHHHFWTPHPYKYPWMTKDFDPINRNFGQNELSLELLANDVDGTVLVQTYSSLCETLQFLDLAATTPSILGVVGWFDMTDPNIGKTIDTTMRHDTGKFLVGVRHQVHDEYDAKWLQRAAVLDALSQIAQRELCYDLLIRPRELASALLVARQFPEITFVVDHIAKPDISNERWNPWADGMAALAELPNVYCKLSGIITEANWDRWRLDQIQPYIAHSIRLFGANRCMFGSDWPVCLLAGSYADTLNVIRETASSLHNSDLNQIMSGTAINAYQLEIVNAS